jgi:Tfp pilus assembly PilM family ATPase
MKKPILGLYLNEKLAHAVLLEQNTSSNRLLAATEWYNTLFDYAGDDTPGVDDFVDHLSRFLAAHKLAEPPQVSVTFDTSLLFLSTVPLSSTVSRSEIDEQVAWELRTHFPDAPADNFISDIHVMAKPGNEDWDEILLVAVRRDLVRKLHRALARLKLQLAVVDGDHFSADTALRFNHPGSASKFIALIGVKPERLDISLVRYLDMESYSYAVIRSEQECFDELVRIAKTTEGLAGMVLYGMIHAELFGKLQSTLTIPVELLNPLRFIDVASAARTHKPLMANPPSYAAALGVALRRD